MTTEYLWRADKMKFYPKIAIMSAVHDFRKNKRNSVSPSSNGVREYNANEFNDYLNKLVRRYTFGPLSAPSSPVHIGSFCVLRVSDERLKWREHRRDLLKFVRIPTARSGHIPERPIRRQNKLVDDNARLGIA